VQALAEVTIAKQQQLVGRMEARNQELADHIRLMLADREELQGQLEAEKRISAQARAAPVPFVRRIPAKQTPILLLSLPHGTCAADAGLQLSQETETIGEYIALYHRQRASLHEQLARRDDYIRQLTAAYNSLLQVQGPVANGDRSNHTASPTGSPQPLHPIVRDRGVPHWLPGSGAVTLV
jgi:hypothetical protein